MGSFMIPPLATAVAVQYCEARFRNTVATGALVCGRPSCKGRFPEPNNLNNLWTTLPCHAAV